MNERSQPIPIVVVDDHHLFRAGLVSLLAGMDEFSVVGEAENGVEALNVIANTHPTIVLLDVNMPVMDGVETVRALRSAGNDLRIVMLTISKRQDDLLGAIRAGANGYLLKNAEPDELREALLRVVSNVAVLAPEITGQVMDALRLGYPQRQSETLTEREIEVLGCLAKGMTTAQIATALVISKNTAKTHVRNILKKLKVSNRTEAVSVAMSDGLLEY